MWCMAGGLPGNAALTLLRCRRRRARPDLGDSMVMALVLFDRCALLLSIDSTLPQTPIVRSTISLRLLKMIFSSGRFTLQPSVALVETWHQLT